MDHVPDSAGHSAQKHCSTYSDPGEDLVANQFRALRMFGDGIQENASDDSEQGSNEEKRPLVRSSQCQSTRKVRVLAERAYIASDPGDDLANEDDRDDDGQHERQEVDSGFGGAVVSGYLWGPASPWSA